MTVTAVTIQDKYERLESLIRTRVKLMVRNFKMITLIRLKTSIKYSKISTRGSIGSELGITTQLETRSITLPTIMTVQIYRLEKKLNKHTTVLLKSTTLDRDQYLMNQL